MTESEIQAKKLKKQEYNKRYQEKLKKKLEAIESKPDNSFFFHQKNQDHLRQSDQQPQSIAQPIPTVQMVPIQNQPSLLWKMGEVTALTICPIVAKLIIEKLAPIILYRPSKQNVGESSAVTLDLQHNIPNW